MREKLQRFMTGRYGVDQFSKFLTWCSIIVLVVSMFIKFTPLYALALLLMGYGYFRMFSRNTYKRYNENAKFMQIVNKIKWFFQGKLKILKISKTHHIYSCPSCKQKIKIPRGKGKISIRCPKCSTEFIKKS